MNKKYCLSFMDVLLGLICIFPIITVLPDDGFLTKFLFAGIFLSYIGVLFSRPVKKSTVLLLLLLVVHYLFVICSTKFPVKNLNLLFYYPFFFLYTYFVCDNAERVTQWLLTRKQYIYMVMILWTVLVGISAFLPSCYYIKEGNTLYFGSYCESIFRLGPTAVFIQILALAAQIMYKQRKAILFSVLPMYCFLMGSSRTYLVLGFCILIIAWYFWCHNRKIFWLTLIPLMGIVAYVISISSLWEKILYTLNPENYGDFWFRLTSSRSQFWGELLTEWSKTGVLHKILGNDLSFTINTIGIWAHNDFFEILCSFGILGLLHYLYAIRKSFVSICGGINSPFIIKICVVMVWLFNAFFNMHYVYFCAMLSYPILLLTVRYHMQNKQKTDHER